MGWGADGRPWHLAADVDQPNGCFFFLEKPGNSLINFGDYSSFHKNTFKRKKNYILVLVKSSQPFSPPAIGAPNLKPIPSLAKKINLCSRFELHAQTDTPFER